ncbi:L-seryl-tRNA selenium transferase [Erysipelothrix larvae]|uniref:L-seryl-tRNA selenium transferase n=1 Tax=Erysipelothrix larvae TaxID=1514105 RepID=A0A0X8H214_9FIRM|nr:DgaE family pyridoxal phosphate-dependent ammonia lyase [Erysipelothrix larvae]AMC94580.1 L-seryl-tRNA selenium transferase [Erysipelothrix larvae]
MNELNLTRVINASGKMSILGVSKVQKTAIEAQQYGAQNFFVIEELIEKTGSQLSQLTGYPAATIVASASSGIALCVAGCIAKDNDHALLHPYDPTLTKREVVIMKGHNVDYGAPVQTMIELGGGVVVEAGYANGCTASHVKACLNENTCALMYVVSHHTVQKSMLSLEDMIQISKASNVPLIVDAAAEEALTQYVNQAIDCVIFSGAKAIEGPSSGLVFGSVQAIDWVRRQSKGIGRAMKIGKENILGLYQATKTYLSEGNESGASMIERIEPWLKDMKALGINASITQDGAGRDIYRLKIIVEDAPSLISSMKQQNPAVYTREYYANQGIIEFDVRALNQDDMRIITQYIESFMKGNHP